MRPVVELLEEHVSKAMAAASGVDNAQPAVRVSQYEKFGDFQANGVMGLSKKLKRKGPELAQEVVRRLSLDGICREVTVAGPGFINLFLDPAFIADCLSSMSRDENAGIEPVSAPQTVAVDFSCPNVAKEMHIGHIRSTIIGDAVSRLLEMRGHNVRRINHIGDWGTQFGMLIQYLRKTRPEAIDGTATLSISSLENFYREAKRCFDEDAAFAEEARKEVTRLQGGDTASLRAWQAICDVSRRRFQDNYDILDVRIEEMGESFYNPFLPSMVEDLLERGVAAESEGAVCIFVKGIEAPFMVRKSDGGFGYAATDLAALRYRVGELGAKRIIYVTDARQKEHFRQLFSAARMAGYAGEDMRLDHVAFGAVLGNDGKPLKTRSGKNVLLKDVIQEAVRRARSVVEEKNDAFDPEEKERIARIVGLGALKYVDLRQNISSDYVFDWDRMLSLEGDTAPYLQYAYARICSIFRKGGVAMEDVADVKPALEAPEELRLGTWLIRYNEIVNQAASECRPNLVANYIYELAVRFTSFYSACPVLKADSETMRRARLFLCRLTARVTAHGLGLLGIRVSERM